MCNLRTSFTAKGVDDKATVFLPYVYVKTFNFSFELKSDVEL